ncbi:MAG: hypothetical protein ACC655_03870 [Rhodothermia bacterium]
MSSVETIDWDTPAEIGGTELEPLSADDESYARSGPVVSRIYIGFREASLDVSDYDAWPTLVQHKHEFAGEVFDLKFEGGALILSRRAWSLVGIGNSLVDAEQDLISCAKDLWPVYAAPEEPMTTEALAMRDFMLRVIDGTS